METAYTGGTQVAIATVLHVFHLVFSRSGLLQVMPVRALGLLGLCDTCLALQKCAFSSQ